MWGGVGERSGVKDMTKQRGNGSKKKKKLKSSRRGQQPVTAASKHVEDEIQDSSEDGPSGAGSSESPRRPGTGPNVLAPSSKPLSHREQPVDACQSTARSAINFDNSPNAAQPGSGFEGALGGMGHGADIAECGGERANWAAPWPPCVEACAIRVASSGDDGWGIYRNE